MNTSKILELIGCAVFSLILGASSVQAKSGMSGGFSSSSSSGASRSSSSSSYKSPSSSSVNSREMSQSSSQKRALDNYDARNKPSLPPSYSTGSSSSSVTSTPLKSQPKSDPSSADVYRYAPQSGGSSFFSSMAWFMLGHEISQGHQQTPVVSLITRFIDALGNIHAVFAQAWVFDSGQRFRHSARTR